MLVDNPVIAFAQLVKTNKLYPSVYTIAKLALLSWWPSDAWQTIRRVIKENLRCLLCFSALTRPQLHFRWRLLMHFLCKCNYSVEWGRPPSWRFSGREISQVVSSYCSNYNRVFPNWRWTGNYRCLTTESRWHLEEGQLSVLWTPIFHKGHNSVASSSTAAIKINLITLHNWDVGAETTNFNAPYVPFITFCLQRKKFDNVAVFN